MTVKKSTLALATALAACFVGCEWTGSDESDSWSNTYDGMNFSGTYRAVTTASNVSSTTTTTDTTSTEINEGSFASVQESGGSFPSGKKVANGRTQYANIVPGSFSAAVGEYVWNDDGNGKLVFTNPDSGASSSSETSTSTTIQGEEGKTTTGAKDYTWNLNHVNVSPGTVSVSLDGAQAFYDDGAGGLKAKGVSGSGSINYASGEITVNFNAPPGSGKKLTVSYTYNEAGTTVVSSSLSGSGTIQYSSGAWTLQINPAQASGTILIRYSYYVMNSTSSASYAPINTSTGTEVSAITVSQNGQNLTFTLNNGIRMSGKFTNVQQTGKINEDTSSGYNTYNAQFQVQSQDTRMVGSLNYDLQTGYRMLNGTWTWGKNTYDVQARGPAWKNSVDDSTLSVDTITKAGNSNTKSTGTAYYGTGNNANANANPYASGNQAVNVGTVQNVNPMSNR